MIKPGLIPQSDDPKRWDFTMRLTSPRHEKYLWC